MGSSPKGANFVGFTSCGKGPSLDGQGNKFLEVFDVRVFVARFPIPHGAPGDSKVRGQRRLRQSKRIAQSEHNLPEGSVGISVEKPLHTCCLSLRFSQTWQRKQG